MKNLLSFLSIHANAVYKNYPRLQLQTYSPTDVGVTLLLKDGSLVTGTLNSIIVGPQGTTFTLFRSLDRYLDKEIKSVELQVDRQSFSVPLT